MGWLVPDNFCLMVMMSLLSCWFSRRIQSERLRIKFMFIRLQSKRRLTTIDLKDVGTMETMEDVVGSGWNNQLQSNYSRVVVFSALIRQYICLISPKIKPFMSPPLLPPSVSPKVIPFHLLIFICNTVHYYSQPMAMNTRDERLYHYEYRRPRMHNPTYNSINVFDSLNMFVRNDFPSPLMRSYGKYSLNKEETPMNRSEIINSRYYRPNENLSTIQPPRQAPRREVMLNDKDYLYLQMIDEKNRRTRNSRNYDYGMGGSRLSENAENRQYQMKGGDSLTKEVKQFQARREE